MKQISDKFFQSLKVTFGKGCIGNFAKVSDNLSSFPIRRALFISDADSRDKDSRRSVLFNVAKAGVDAVEYHWQPTVAPGAEPNIDTVTKVLKHAQNTGCDSVIAVGCNQSMNLGKAVSLLQNQLLVGDNLRLIGFYKEDDIGMITNPNYVYRKPYPLITVPVLDSQGAESSSFVRFQDWNKEFTYWQHDKLYYPSHCVVDPNLMYMDKPTKEQIQRNAFAANFNLHDAFWTSGAFDELNDMNEVTMALYELQLLRDDMDKAATYEECEQLLFGTVHAGYSMSQQLAGTPEIGSNVEHDYGKSSLLRVMTQSICSMIPLKEQDVLLALFHSVAKFEEPYLDATPFLFEAENKYAQNRESAYAEYLDQLVFKSKTSFDNLKLDTMGVELYEEQLELLLERILCVAHRMEIPCDKSIVRNILNSCLENVQMKER